MTEETKFSVSRRTLAKGAAWSVPAVAVAAAAPAYAASGAAPKLTYLGACKYPGNNCDGAVFQGYAFQFDVKNESSEDIHICKPSLAAPDSGLPTTTAWVPYSGTNASADGQCLKIPAGTTGSVAFFFTNTGNSANKTFDATLTLPWGHQCPCGADPDKHPALSLTFTVAETPPKYGCTCDRGWVQQPALNRTGETSMQGSQVEANVESAATAESEAVKTEPATVEAKSEAKKAEQSAPAKSETPAPAKTEAPAPAKVEATTAPDVKADEAPAAAETPAAEAPTEG